MNTEIKMSVSPITRNDDKKCVYALFTDGNKSAEFAVPECKVVSNNNFSQDEINQLLDYVRNQQDYIFSLAKEINPLKAFLDK